MKLVDTLKVLLKEFWVKVDFEKKSADGKKAWKLPSRQGVNPSTLSLLDLPIDNSLHLALRIAFLKMLP